MKGGITLKILEGILEAAGELDVVIESFLTAGYGASMKKLSYTRSKLMKERNRDSFEITQKTAQKARFTQALYRLKQDNLIGIRQRRGVKELFIRPKGWRMLDKLRERLKAGDLPLINYPRITSPSFIIAAFDIPERERRKRDWLRLVFKSLDLKMIQKSVWAGKIKLPEELLEDLATLGISDYVEIFSINKHGTLRKINA